MKALAKTLLAVAALAPMSSHATTFISRASFNGAVTGETVVEDFETAGPVNAVLASLVRPSATFVGQAGVPIANVYVIDPTANNFALGGAAIGSQVLTANGDESFLINLASAQKAVGFDVFLNDLGLTSVSFFAGATLVDTIDFAADASTANNRTFAGIVSKANITSLTFVSTAGGSLNSGIDNLTFAVPASVPEPATWAMMIAGLGLAGFARRSRVGRVGYA